MPPRSLCTSSSSSPHPPLSKKTTTSGLDNSGKTTATAALTDGDTSAVAPTLGFQIRSLRHAATGTILNLWDVGGQRTLRPFWRNYFEKTDGLAWVVDASDGARLGDCALELRALLAEERLAGAPLLVLANKQDVRGALGPREVARALGLEGGEGGAAEEEEKEEKRGGDDSDEERKKNFVTTVTKPTRKNCNRPLFSPLLPRKKSSSLKEKEREKEEEQDNVKVRKQVDTVERRKREKEKKRRRREKSERPPPLSPSLSLPLRSPRLQKIISSLIIASRTRRSLPFRA